MSAEGSHQDKEKKSNKEGEDLLGIGSILESATSAIANSIEALGVSPIDASVGGTAGALGMGEDIPEEKKKKKE